jgi:acetyl esterase
MPLDAQLAGLLQLIEAGTPLYELTPDEARASFRRLTVDLRPPESVVPVGEVSETTVAGAAGELRARVYRPEVSTSSTNQDRSTSPGWLPTVAMFHGGGFVIGDLDTHDNMARAICSVTEAVVVSVDYRLAPEHKFPAAAEDAIAATRDIQARLTEFGGSGVLAVAGDSAGGNLAAVAAQHVPGLSGQLLIYPATDVLGDYPSREENKTGYFLDQPTMAWFIEQYADDDTDFADPKISPLLGKLEGLPPAVVVTAELDPLRDEGIAYADALHQAGVQVQQRTFEGIIHGFFDMGPHSAACQRAVEETLRKFAELLRA